MKFRKRPVVIEAMQYRSVMDLAPAMDFLGDSFDGYEEESTTHRTRLLIDTKEGVMRADEGDWLIRGVKGEHYACKPDIFEATYDKVCENEAWECDKIQRQQQQKIDALTAAGREARELISHAIELDHLGGGSTRGWAQNVLTQLKKVVGNECED